MSPIIEIPITTGIKGENSAVNHNVLSIYAYFLEISIEDPIESSLSSF